MYKKKIQSMQLIALILIAGVIIFAVIVYTGITVNQPIINDDLSYVLAAIMILCMLISLILGRNQLSKMNSSEPVMHRIEKYQTALIIRLAPLEAAAFIACFIAFKNNNSDYLVSVVVLVVMMLSYFPFNNRLINDLKLNENEKNDVFSKAD